MVEPPFRKTNAQVKWGIMSPNILSKLLPKISSLALMKPHLENQLLLISSNFTPKTSNPVALKKWYEFLGFPGIFKKNGMILHTWSVTLTQMAFVRVFWGYKRRRTDLIGIVTLQGFLKKAGRSEAIKGKQPHGWMSRWKIGSKWLITTWKT